jgi:hypothetical protein
VSIIIDSCRPREGTFNPEIFTVSLSQVISHYATPVDASELSRVLAKCLFLPIDPTAVKIAAAMYGELYARISAALPDEVVQAGITRPVSSGSRSGPERGTHPERWLRRHRCAREGE